jgi:hypothetical protein
MRARADAREARRFGKFRKKLRSLGVSEEAEIEKIWNMAKQPPKEEK